MMQCGVGILTLHVRGRMAGKDARPTHDNFQTGIVFSDGLIQIIANPCRYFRCISLLSGITTSNPRRAGIFARRMIQTCEAEWRAGMPALRMEIFSQAFFSDGLIQIIANPCRYFRCISLLSGITTSNPRRAGIFARRMIQTCEAEWRAGMPALRMIIFRQALFFQTA
ncbi:MULTISPECIES: hypothetical protein [unclassified Neisseria]|uniref:hypothetical protein n=1 Tax=unclassified Neisseria TaxID=2623750 RepID=UPI0026667FC4|nr:MULTISPECIES: hypothetical protein [unclassified Neisseria]MDO1508842.1 hypothetical protein [Neisseria sp. MVDL19-042950]MDO1515101.1 hypothetical protein [Neisseria sp. MVDL18-041461]MDO1562461.1 hypothetical protein [Neisseria sp. MVDL20-010259]